jgi:hypothetical protein
MAAVDGWPPKTEPGLQAGSTSGKAEVARSGLRTSYGGTDHAVLVLSGSRDQRHRTGAQCGRGVAVAHHFAKVTARVQFSSPARSNPRSE